MNTKTERLIITGCKHPLSEGFHNFLSLGFDNPIICQNCAEEPKFNETKKCPIYAKEGQRLVMAKTCTQHETCISSDSNLPTCKCWCAECKEAK